MGGNKKRGNKTSTANQLIFQQEDAPKNNKVKNPKCDPISEQKIPGATASFCWKDKLFWISIQMYVS